MKAFFKLFQTQVQKYANIQYYIDCRGPPEKLLRELKTPAQKKKLVKFLSCEGITNPIKLIRVFTIANLLLLYSKDFFQLIQQHLKYRQSKDQWINKKFLEPYYRFLIKCSTSKDMYNLSKNLIMKKGEAFEMLFYSVNMMKFLFKTVEKMPFFGRYYKSKYNQTISSAIEVIACQAQKIYGSFKHSLTEILYHKEFYIREKTQQAIVKGILVDELTIINEEMKKLFLDKYFYPLGKGIGVKLFRPEEQTPQCEKTINSITSNHQNTQRQKKHDELQKTLFPGSGLVNWNFFQETMIGGPLLNATANIQNQSKFKDLDQLAISEEDQQTQQIPVANIGSKGYDKGASQKQTNSGSFQIKGNEM